MVQKKKKKKKESISTNKASGGDRIPAELFQVLKDDAVKVLQSMGSQRLGHDYVAEQQQQQQ